LGAEALVWQGARAAHTPRRATLPDGMDRRPNMGSYFGANPKIPILAKRFWQPKNTCGMDIYWKLIKK